MSGGKVGLPLEYWLIGVKDSTPPTLKFRLFPAISFRICRDFHLFHISRPAEGLHTFQDRGINKHSGARSAPGFAQASVVDGRQL